MAALLLAGTAAAQAEGCSKSVRWNDDPPYFIPQADGSPRGIGADLSREILHRLGCTPRYVELPWARGLNNLRNGTLDILPGALRTPERETFAYFSRPVNVSPNVLFIARSAAPKYRFQQLSEIIGSDFRLGAQIDVVYSSEYQALTGNPDFARHLTRVNSRRGAWRMIKAGRIDGLIADEVTGLLELKQMQLDDAIVRSELIVASEPAHYALSRQTLDPAFVDRFNQALEAMMADGTYQRILETYLPCRVSAAKLGCE